MYRLKKDSWKPARLREIDYIILGGMFVGIALNRGLDYAFGNDQYIGKEFMTDAASSQVWGLFGFTLGAFFLGFGMITKRHMFVYIGHGWLAVTYSLNSIALFIPLLSDFPYFDGIRGVGAVLIIAAIHWMMMVRTGAHPLNIAQRPVRDQVIVVEEGSKGDS